MKKLMMSVALIIGFITPVLAYQLPLGLNLNLEGGAVFSSGFDANRIYAQGTVDKTFGDTGLTVGVGLNHINQLGDGVYDLRYDGFLDAEVIGDGDQSLLIPGLSDENNENNFMAHARYEYKHTSNFSSEVGVSYISGINQLGATLGAGYALSKDVKLVGGYSKSTNQGETEYNDKFDSEGLYLAVRVNVF